MRESETKIMPGKVLFRKSQIVLEISSAEKYRIPYREIVWAYVRTKGDEPGGGREPELAEITEETEGELIIYDRQRHRWMIGTGRAGKKAGALLKELCIHAPYIVAGGQEWFDHSGEADFSAVEEMVRLMRECGRG